MFCSRCGKEQVGEVKYCSNCGADVTAPVSAAATMPSVKSMSATGFVIGSCICSAIALAFLPPVFGGAGFVLGYFAFRRRRTAGTICMAISGVCMLIGGIIGAWVWITR